MKSRKCCFKKGEERRRKMGELLPNTLYTYMKAPHY
jgi:hypothetical protein